MDRRRTRGMTAIAVLNILVGGLGILSGLFHLLGAVVLMLELWRLGVFEIPGARFAFPLLVVATGVVGLIAGFGMFALRPWARALSLAFGGLLLLSAVVSCLAVPILASIGAYDLGSMRPYDLARLIIFSVGLVISPVIYSVVLWIVFTRPTWRSAFAKGRTA
jgi:hypothetical protein